MTLSHVIKVEKIKTRLGLMDRLQRGIRRFRENGMSIFYCAGCKFLWLAHWSKGEEVRSENELIAKMLASVN